MKLRQRLPLLVIISGTEYEVCKLFALVVQSSVCGNVSYICVIYRKQTLSLSLTAIMTG